MSTDQDPFDATGPVSELDQAIRAVLAMPREQPVETPKATPSAVDGDAKLRDLRELVHRRQKELPVTGERSAFQSGQLLAYDDVSIRISEVLKATSAPPAPEPATPPAEEPDRCPSSLNCELPDPREVEKAFSQVDRRIKALERERDEWKARAMAGYQVECDIAFTYQPVVDILCKRIARLLTEAEARKP